MRGHKRFLTLGAAMILGCGGGGDNNPPTGPPGGGNRNPTVNLNIDQTHLAYGQMATLSVTASDPDGDQVTFSWSAALGTTSSSGPTATTATFTAGNQWGQASITVTASDGKGGSAQATALTYIRNPNPPRFAFYPVASTNCGFGTPNPNGFMLQIRPPEGVVITRIAMRPYSCATGCLQAVNYTSNPITLGAGQDYVWDDGFCRTPDCCENRGCGSCGYWTIEILGRRAEPDGGNFTFSCNSWSTSQAADRCD